MNTENKSQDRSIHISYTAKKQTRLIRKLLQMINNTASQEDKNHKFSIIDLGCGRGELLEELAAQNKYELLGLDGDDVCVELSSKYTKCLKGNMYNLEDVMSENQVDMAVLSHSLEHMRDPQAVLQQVRRISRKWILIAVPNPLGPKFLIKHGILRKNYSNKGHYCCWDRSHLNNFIQIHCNLKIQSWGIDEVRFIPFKPLRSFFAFLRILDFIEVKMLTKILPYMSSSLIVLCDVNKSSNG